VYLKVEFVPHSKHRLGCNSKLKLCKEITAVCSEVRAEQLYAPFAEYNQQDATFLNLFIYVRRSTCFRRFFRPSSGAQNCTYSVRYLSDPAGLVAGSSNGLTNT